MSEALDIAETSLTSLSDDLKDRLSLSWRQRTGEQVSRSVTSEKIYIECSNAVMSVHLCGILHHTCRQTKSVLVDYDTKLCHAFESLEIS